MKNFFSDKNIEIYSLIYIIIPYLIFNFDWLKIPLALVLSVLVVFSIFSYAKKLNNKDICFEFANKKLKYFLFAFLIIVIWCLLSGMGGFGYQNNPDYEKNNAIFHDLFLYKWPIIYDNFSFIYYLGYYLPTGLVMKLLGWNAGYLFSFMWGFLGLILAVYWLQRLSGKFSSKIILLFIFFSGLDFLGLILKFLIFPQVHPIIGNYFHIEWWAGFFQYSSMTTSLFWVPQYAIQGWLLTGLILNNIENHKSSRNLLFLWALCIFGVPFVFLAMIPIILAGIYKTKAKDLFSFQNTLAAPAIILVIMLYFTSKAFKDPSQIIFSQLKNPYFVVVYLLFILMEFGIYAIFIHKYFKNDIIWNVNLISLILMPFIRIGGGNEFNMRGSLCYLFIFFVFFAKALNDKYNMSKFRKIILLIIFFIGAITPLCEITRSIVLYSAKIPVLSDQYSVMDLYHYRKNSQYLGKKDSFFFKYLAKQN